MSEGDSEAERSASDRVDNKFWSRLADMEIRGALSDFPEEADTARRMVDVQLRARGLSHKDWPTGIRREFKRMGMKKPNE